MRKLWISIALCAGTLLPFTAQATDLITYEAFSQYSTACAKAGGQPYVSSDRGRTWSPIHPEEARSKAEYIRSMTELNLMMSGQAINSDTLTKYLKQEGPILAKKLEKQKAVRCKGAKVRFK